MSEELQWSDLGQVERSNLRQILSYTQKKNLEEGEKYIVTSRDWKLEHLGETEIDGNTYEKLRVSIKKDSEMRGVQHEWFYPTGVFTVHRSKKKISRGRGRDYRIQREKETYEPREKY